MAKPPPITVAEQIAYFEEKLTFTGGSGQTGPIASMREEIESALRMLRDKNPLALAKDVGTEHLTKGKNLVRQVMPNVEPIEAELEEAVTQSTGYVENALDIIGSVGRSILDNAKSIWESIWPDKDSSSWLNALRTLFSSGTVYASGLLGLTLPGWVLPAVVATTLAAITGGIVYSLGDKPIADGPLKNRPAQYVPAEAPGTVAGPLKSKNLDISGEWVLNWNWTVTTVAFGGHLSGGPDVWQFEGAVDSGGNAIWTPKKGSTTVQCTLKLTNAATGAATMSGSANFPQGAWKADSDGTLTIYSAADGKQRFSYRGSGWGAPGADGKRPHIDHLDLDLKSD